jgi:hypothetical protein
VLAASGVSARHEIRRVAVGLPETRGVLVTTMGRSAADDPAFFLAAAAAGAVAVESAASHR